MLIKKTGLASSPNIDLTPVIDMVFLLLIFFLVTTTYHQVEREMQIALPEAESSAPISVALRELVINVSDDGAVYIAGQQHSLDELRALVSSAVEANPKQKVSVRGDRNATYGDVAQVLDICKGAGIAEPFLDTVPTQ
jgi:biopolymer transport protein ExbD